MIINLIADSSVASAPSGFVSAVEQAASVFEQDFSGNYTVNIRYGWGTYNNQADDELTTNPTFSWGGTIGGASGVSYAKAKAWLIGNAALSDQIAADAYLPASYLNLPDDADDFYVSSAQEKALGVYTGSSTAIDGAIGFGTETTDWLGLALTEIAHALGWLSGLNTTIGDLFRYSSSGQFDWTGGQSGEYFSVDGGATDLANFDVKSLDGLTDYTLFQGPADDALYFPQGNDVTTLSALDIEALNAIGFGGSGLSGGGHTAVLADLANNTAFLDYTAGEWDTVEGSNGTIDLTDAAACIYGADDAVEFLSGSGNAAALFNTDGAWDNVFGSNGVVELNSVTSTVSGGGDVIYFVSGSSDAAALFNTAGAWDNVFGSNGVVELNSVTATVSGGGDVIYFTSGSGDAAALFSTGGAWDNVVGSSGVVELNSATATISGGGDVIYFTSGSGDAAALFNTGGAWDNVVGSGGVVELNSATATVSGGSDTIYFTSGSGDAAALFSSNGTWDNVSGSNGVVELNSVTATVNGGGDTVYFTSGSGDAAALFSSNGNWDNVSGSNGVVELNSVTATVAGSGDTIYFASGAGNVAALFNTGSGSDTLVGSSGVVELNGATTAIDGGGDTVYFDGGQNSASISGSAEALVFQPTFGLDTINGYTSADTLVFSASDQGKLAFNQSNGNTYVSLDGGDVLTLTNASTANLGAIIYR